eukprot:Gb_23395 [translate_table: standard]
MDASRSQQIDPKAQAQAWDFIFSFVPALVLKSALLLKIPDIIARAGPDAHLSLQQIAAQLPTQNPSLDYLSRILRYLAVKGIFTHSTATDTSEVRYGLTDMAKLFFVSESNPLSLVPMLLMQNHEAYGRSDPQVNDIFNSAMASVTKVSMKQIVGFYQGFKDVKTVVDVGGGVGMALADIIGVYPHIHGINFDLPHVVANAPDLPGIQHVGGNMFESVPSGDAIFMKSVLHDWDDERCLEILENCHKALPENGKIMLAETVLPEQSDPNQGIEILSDLVMIAHANGGRERSEGQWRGLLEKAGFSGIKIVGRAEVFSTIVEAVKFTYDVKE